MTRGILGRHIQQLFGDAEMKDALDNAAPPALFAPLPGKLAQQQAALAATPQTTLATLAAQPQAAAPKRSRRKLWQLEDKLHCPVVGTCLPMDDLAQLGKRFRFMAGRDNEFSLHVEAVNQSREKTPFAEALQKLFERRYLQAIKNFDAARSDEELRRLWRQHLQLGDVAGALWALVTHPLASVDTRDQAYGDIHMLSHQVGAGQTADVRRMEAMGREIAELKQTLEMTRQETARRENLWQVKLQARLAEERQQDSREQEIQQLQARLERFENGMAMVDMGRKLLSHTASNEHLQVVAERARQQEEEIRVLQESLAATRQERDLLAAEREALETLMMAEAPGSCGESCDDSPGSESIRGRRILCVGGRSQLVIHYRRLAEKLGIKLIHHDGGMEESLSRLPDMISGADAVICPTDCVSHPAYYRIKSQCKRQGKPCFLFKGAGVSSFAAALVRISNEESTSPSH